MKKLSKDQKKKALIISGVATVLICLIMNLWIIPSINKQSVEGQKIFDMRPTGYSFDDAKYYVYSLSAEGNHIYRTRQLPLDFIYPVAYTAFFYLAIEKLFKNKKKLKYIAFVLPVFDYIENIMVLCMLNFYGGTAMVQISSIATIVKSLLMYVIFGILIVGVIKLLNERRYRKI